MKKKLLQIELNEFSYDLLSKYSLKYELKNINKLLELNHANIYTQEKIEHRELDPWVQWVSIHTGEPLICHGIRYLGESTNKLRINQIWDQLAQSNIKTGLWCLMNVKYIPHENISFYLPDPWCSNQNSKPSILNEMIALPEYYSRNYLNLSIWKLLTSFLKSTKFIIKKCTLKDIFQNITILINSIKYIKQYTIVLFAIFDLFSTIVFVRFRKKYQPDYSIIFINCIAHMQHHNWINECGNNINLYVFRIIDKILYLLTKDMDESDGLILMNGFSQRYENSEYYCYRQKDPYEFFNQLDIPYIEIKVGMTNDSIITFKSVEDLELAKNILEETYINDIKLFYVDIVSLSNKELFYRVDIRDNIDVNTFYTINNIRRIFYNDFVKIANRTGSHIPKGDIFFNNIHIEDNIRNDQLNKYIKEFFNEV